MSDSLWRPKGWRVHAWWRLAWVVDRLAQPLHALADRMREHSNRLADAEWRRMRARQA